MMISPSACRMGLVTTSRRKIGACLSGHTSTGSRRAFLTIVKDSKLASTVAGAEQRLWAPLCLGNSNRSDTHSTFTSGNLRFKSTRAAATFSDDSDDDDGHLEYAVAGSEVGGLEVRTRGLAAAAHLRATDKLAHDEAWMINLGRGNDNEWLTGPRGDEWFTGVHPRDCPGADTQGKIRSLPLPNLSAVTREAAKEYFDNSWTLYETLFAGLNGEEYFYRPPVHGLRHPQIFYYGHTACLYVNKLRVSGVLSKPVNAYFESIFEVGVDEMLWDDMHKNDMLWPMVSEVHEYKKKVYDTVVDAIMTHPSLEPAAGDKGVKVDQSHPMWALFLGFEHERIHFETSSVLFREAPYHLVQTPQYWPPMHPSAFQENGSPTTSHPAEGQDYPANRMIAVKMGAVDLGKPADFPSFGWDNEYGERNVTVPPFQASEHMITNGEFWHFVADGGYRSRQFWCDDGWHWRTHRNMKWPFFWEPAGPAGTNQFSLRTIFEIVNMPWGWPVDVNYYEAKAYCRWKTEVDGSPASQSYRILTEAEHHLIRNRDHGLEAARKNVSADKVMVTSGKDFASGNSGTNLNLAFSSQNPVDFFPPSQTGHRDTTGNSWEWTEDHFNPLKGFEVHHVYDDFSMPCFDGKHSMIVGGSFISTGDEASTFARFHFRPHFLQHSGFRLVASNSDAPATHLFAGNFGGQAAAAGQQARAPEEGSSSENSNVYESDDSLHMYLGLHYPSSGDKEGVAPILPHENAPTHGLRFPQRVAKLLKSLKPECTNNWALDIGCAVGGASFELAKTFDRVDAFDFSESFVRAAKRMQTLSEDEVSFRVPVEAELFEDVKALHDVDVTKEVRSGVNFFCGDAQMIAEMKAGGALATYDGVVMSNLLCRLPNPALCIDGLPHVVNKGGVVVMVTPFSWLLEFTPRSKWLGGFCDPVSKEPIYSKDVLEEMMEDRGFEKIHEEEMPLVIREHQRKYQYIVSEATGWRKLD